MCMEKLSQLQFMLNVKNDNETYAKMTDEFAQIRHGYKAGTHEAETSISKNQEAGSKK